MIQIEIAPGKVLIRIENCYAIVTKDSLLGPIQLSKMSDGKVAASNSTGLCLAEIQSIQQSLYKADKKGGKR